MCTNFVLIGCCVSELCVHLCPYRNLWPEIVYGCFTRATMFTEFLESYNYRSLSLQLNVLPGVFILQ